MPVHLVTGSIIAGSNITLTGTGVIGDPYIIIGTPPGTPNGAHAFNNGTSNVSTDTAAAPNTKYKVDTTSGNKTLTLPSTATVGDRIVGQKSDASVNLLNIVGNIDGVSSTTNSVRTQNQGKEYEWSGSTWVVTAGDVSVSALDSRYVQPSQLATVATTGSYADLTNKPTYATVATTGSYNDLTNKPTIPTATPPGGATTQVQYNNAGVFAGVADFRWDNTNRALLLGSNAASFNNTDWLHITDSINDTVQANIQNTSNGTSASSDWIATADTGTNSTNYIDMGINSSTYADTGFTITGPLDGYLYTNGGNLSIGTQTAAKTILFHTGGTLAANLRATLSDTGLTLVTPLAITSGGTGSATKNFVDLTTVQTVAGTKTWSDDATFNGSISLANGKSYNVKATDGSLFTAIKANGGTGVQDIHFFPDTTATKFGNIHFFYNTNVPVNFGAGPTKPSALYFDSATGAIFRYNGSSQLVVTSTGVYVPSGSGYYVKGTDANHYIGYDTSNDGPKLVAFTATTFRGSGGAEWSRINSTGIGFGTAPTHTITVPSTGTGVALYNTTDQTTNYERLRHYVSGNSYYIASEAAGTGMQRGIYIQNFSSQVNNIVQISSNTSSLSVYDFKATNGKIQMSIGATTAGTTGVRVTGNYTGTNNVQRAFVIEPTINQSSTAGYTALLINPTQTAVGSGSKLLADFQVGGTSIVRIGNQGTIVTDYTGNPGVQIGTNSGGGYLRLGDATLKKLPSNFFSFNNDGVQGINQLRLGNDSAQTGAGSSILDVTNNVGDVTRVLGRIYGSTGQTGRLTEWLTPDKATTLVSVDSVGKLYTKSLQIQTTTAPTVGQVWTATDTAGNGSWQTGGSGNTTNTFNDKRVDQVNGGTSPYGTLAGTVNGTNTVFTVSNGSYTSGSLDVYLNGQKLTVGSTGDLTETAPTSGTFTFNVAPPTGAIVQAAYTTVSSSSTMLQRTLFTSTASNTVNNTTTETSFTAATGVGSMTIPANSMAPGRVYTLMTYGTYQTPVSPGQVIVKIKMGGVIIAQATVTASILATSSVLRALYGIATITVRSIGTTGTVTCSGYMTFETATGATTVPFSTVATNNTTRLNSTVTINTTVANLLEGTETWSNAQDPQGTTIDQISLEVKN